ncbi:hypothetical protein CC79DRAFT_217089 [Sarocladium strictum]
MGLCVVEKRTPTKSDGMTQCGSVRRAVKMQDGKEWTRHRRWLEWVWLGTWVKQRSSFFVADLLLRNSRHEGQSQLSERVNTSRQGRRDGKPSGKLRLRDTRMGGLRDSLKPDPAVIPLKSVIKSTRLRLSNWATQPVTRDKLHQIAPIWYRLALSYHRLPHTSRPKKLGIHHPLSHAAHRCHLAALTKSLAASHREHVPLACISIRSAAVAKWVRSPGCRTRSACFQQ